MKAIVPSKILVKVTVNDALAADLRSAGFEAYKRTVTQEAAIEQRHTVAAKERGVNPLRFAQEGGRQVADSGTPVFGREGQHNVSLVKVAEDITAQLPALKLVGVNIQTKTDGKHVVWQVYEPTAKDKPVVVPSGAIKFHLDALNKRVYGNLHVWRNPDGSVTVNAGSPTNDSVSGAKDLRIHEQGQSIRCVERPKTAAKPPAAIETA